MTKFEQLVLWFILLYIREKIEEFPANSGIFKRYAELQDDISKYVKSLPDVK